jgi:peptide chain release factor
LASAALFKSAAEARIDAELINSTRGNRSNCFKSVSIKLDGAGCETFAKQWHGPMQWICTSPFRPKHKRKNWFFSGQVFAQSKTLYSSDIKFQSCRASGAGGQHVNTTDSAVRATHVQSGISVRVESQRSQHANKRLASLLIAQKLTELNAANAAQHQHSQWQQHWQVERGNAVRVFKGCGFLIVTEQ